MPAQQLSFPAGFDAIRDLPKQRTSLVNWYNDGQNNILCRFGIDLHATFPSGFCRGSYVFNEVLYTVYGNTLYKVSGNGMTTPVGFIAASDPVAFAASFTELVIVVKDAAGKGYVCDGTTVTEIVDPSFLPSIDVAYMDGRFIYIPFDGSPAFYSAVYAAATIEGFFDAEVLPDKNTGIINLRNDLYILGAESAEIFRSTGDVDAPFIRNQGSTVDTGYVAARQEFAGTFAFLGRDRGLSYGFFAMQQGKAQRISNRAIDEVLSREYSVSELNDCESSVVEIYGIEMVLFTLARHTFVFTGAGWHLWKSGVDGAGVNKRWRGTSIQFAYGKYFVGDNATSKFGVLSESHTEYGEAIEYYVQMFLRAPRGTYFGIAMMELDCLTGMATQSHPDPQISVQVSRDGNTFFAPYWRPLGQEFQYSQRVQFNPIGGLGLFEAFAGIIFRTTAPVRFSAEQLTVEIT